MSRDARRLVPKARNPHDALRLYREYMDGTAECRRILDDAPAQMKAYIEKQFEWMREGRHWVASVVGYGWPRFQKPARDGAAVHWTIDR